MEQKKNNSGALFINNNRKSENHPHLNGSIIVEGVEYWISAWKKTTESNNTMFSLSVTAKQPQQEEQTPKDFLDFLEGIK